MSESDTENTAVILERLGRILQNDGHATELKPTQWEALRYLSKANRFSRSPSAVTSYLGMTKGTVSQTLMALERKGLISKQTDPNDRRNIDLEVTKSGLELLDNDPISQISNIISSLPPKRHGNLDASLKELLRMVLAKRGDPPFGVCNKCRHFKRAASRGGEHACQLLKVTLSNVDSEMHCIEMEPADG